MKYFTITILLIVLTAAQLAAQSDTATKVIKERSKFSKNIGIGFGFSYSNIALDAKPFVLVDSTAKLGYVNTQNGLGINISLYYHIKINERFFIRPGVDANIMRARLEYDTQLKNKKTADIFPVAIEIPISASWYVTKNTDAENLASKGMYVSLGVRPVIAIPQFTSLNPTMKTSNLNIDGGIGFPIKMKKIDYKIELIYSYGLFNLIGENENDFYTNSVTELGRSFAGMRFYFN